MERKKLITAFSQLGKLMVQLGQDKDWSGYDSGVTQEEFEQLKGMISKEHIFNGWFTKENVLQAFTALGENLTEEELSKWVSSYSFSNAPKRIALIMAGNIPLVGFHDFLCVLLSGNTAVCKLSSDDKRMLPALAEVLIKFYPEIKPRIEFSMGRMNEFDAVIATGSNNSTKYFEQYFGKYPHIFRKNRTSVAVLSNENTEEELKRLGKDIFNYFGLGCRNVSHLFVPEDFEINRFFEAIIDYFPIVNHNKYANNYDYNKAVYLLNQEPMLDNNFVLLRECEELNSPLGMLHYQRYSSLEKVEDYIQENKEKIQVVVGADYLPFGGAQSPGLTDYPDGVNVLEWLETLA